MSDEESYINTKPFDDLVKALVSNKYQVKIGILGDKNVRDPAKGDGGTSNATIGAAHEFGSAHLPIRSFLRMPMTEEFPKKLEASGILDNDALEQAIKDKSFRQVIKKIAVMGVATVLEAFDTGGFGKWPALSPARLAQRAKKNQGAQILVVADSHQLRDSITYAIEKKI